MGEALRTKVPSYDQALLSRIADAVTALTIDGAKTATCLVMLTEEIKNVRADHQEAFREGREERAKLHEKLNEHALKCMGLVKAEKRVTKLEADFGEMRITSTGNWRVISAYTTAVVLIVTMIAKPILQWAWNLLVTKLAVAGCVLAGVMR